MRQLKRLAVGEAGDGDGEFSGDHRRVGTVTGDGGNDLAAVLAEVAAELRGVRLALEARKEERE